MQRGDSIQDTEAVKQYFNRLAPTWQDDIEAAPIREEILQRTALPPGLSIADVGCGKGIMVPHLLGTSPRRLIELDLSEEMIRLNKKRWGKEPRISFLAEDILAADLPDIDAVIIFNAYPHFLDKKALAEKISRILSEHGIFVIAHSKGKEQINSIHKDSRPEERISIPLRSPLEEYEACKEHFDLHSWEDTPRLYYMKLIKK